MCSIVYIRGPVIDNVFKNLYIHVRNLYNYNRKKIIKHSLNHSFFFI